LNPLSILNQRHSLSSFLEGRTLYTPFAREKTSIPPSTTFNMHATDSLILSHTLLTHSQVLSHILVNSSCFSYLVSPLVYIASLSLLETMSPPPLHLLPLQSVLSVNKTWQTKEQKNCTKICLIEYSARGQSVCVF